MAEMKALMLFLVGFNSDIFYVLFAYFGVCSNPWSPDWAGSLLNWTKAPHFSQPERKKKKLPERVWFTQKFNPVKGTLFFQKIRTWDKPYGKIDEADSEWWWHELCPAESLRAPFGNYSLAVEPKMRLSGVYLSSFFVKLQNVYEFASEWYLWISINIDILGDKA